MLGGESYATQGAQVRRRSIKRRLPHVFYRHETPVAARDKSTSVRSRGKPRSEGKIYGP